MHAKREGIVYSMSMYVKLGLLSGLQQSVWAAELKESSEIKFQIPFPILNKHLLLL